MSSPKLVVSDIDGTLVDKQKRLTQATIDAVERLRAAGLGFTMISARPRSGMMPIADALRIEGPMAAFNGGLIFHRDGRIDAHHGIEPAVARGVLALAADLAVDLWVFADDRWYASTVEGAHVGSERVASDQEPIVRDSFDDLLDRADKITFVSDEPELLRALQVRVDEDFGGGATIALSKPYYLDVTALAANKGTGVEALAAAAGVSLANVAAMGDQANDLPMLTRAGLSIAMGNAPSAVQASADHITGTNDADGVAQAIDTLILPALEQS